MPLSTYSNKTFTGIVLAVVATMVWSGNFIVARGVIKQMPPVSLAFFRWMTAVVFIVPIGMRAFLRDRAIIFKHRRYFIITAFFGITIYNTLLYIAGHHIPAINLALIATTSSPMFSIVLAAVFLKEKIGPRRITGLVICLAGIILLISKGSWQNLAAFHFTAGDGWALAGAFTFAVYNVFVKRKPEGVSPISFLFTVFTAGALMLTPFFIAERITGPAIQWSYHLAFVILYLGLGACIIAYLCWNIAIEKLGAARTALFGNLIPIFSTVEAILILQEQFLPIHLLSGVLVLTGLVIANSRRKSRETGMLNDKKE